MGHYIQVVQIMMSPPIVWRYAFFFNIVLTWNRPWSSAARHISVSACRCPVAKNIKYVLMLYLMLLIMKVMFVKRTTLGWFIVPY